MTVCSSQSTIFFSLKICLLLFKEKKNVMSSVQLEETKKKTTNLQSRDFYTKKKSPTKVIYKVNDNIVAGATEGKSYLDQGERHGSSMSALFFDLNTS